MSVLPLDHLMIRGRPGAPRRPPLESSDERPGLLGRPRRGWGAGLPCRSIVPSGAARFTPEVKGGTGPIRPV